jgi:hypothetical protein
MSEQCNGAIPIGDRDGQPSRITRKDAESAAQNTFSPGALFGQDYLWNSVWQPLSVMAFKFCRIRKLVQEAARDHFDDWDEFGRVCERLGMAQLELDPKIRKLEARALRERWSQKKYDLTLARMVQRRAASQKLRDASPAPDIVTLPYDMSQPQLRACLRLLHLLDEALAGNQVEIGPAEFQAIFADLNTTRRGHTRSDATEEILRLYRSALEQGRKITHGEIARAVYPEYIGAAGPRKRELRESVRQALRNEK